MNNDRLLNALSDLMGLVSRLRGSEGCPWDALQTDSTIKMYLLEEAYEVLEAIERGRPDDVCQELGDLLFQIIFLADLAQDRDEFDLIEVIEKINEKMVRRHPHVFGNESVKDSLEVSNNWQRIKLEEKGALKSLSVTLKDVPIDLPALLRAHRISDRASKVGFDWDGKEDIWEKVREEYEELARAVEDRDKDRIGEEIGDLFFSLVNLSRHWGLNSERLLRDANLKFIKRFKKMEDELKGAGLELKEATFTEMNKAWEKIKDENKNGL
jgi:MazG family protein